MADQYVPVTVTIEDARIIFRNLSGKKDKWNPSGDRSFGLVLTPELAQQMAADGWNVKWIDPRDEGDDAMAWLPVAVNYENRPPRVTAIMSKSGNKTLLTEDTVGEIDSFDLINVDVVIRAYDWHVNGKDGRKAYLQTMYAMVYEDDLMFKYRDTPRSTPEEPSGYPPELD